MAHRAAEMLLARLTGKPVPERVSLATRLLVRQSCGCPDPLVSEAAETPAWRTDWAAGAALDERRSGDPGRMAECWELLLESAPTTRLEQMLDAFAEEMAGRAPGIFLASLAEVLQEALDTGSSISRWQSAISALRRDSLPVSA